MNKIDRVINKCCFKSFNLKFYSFKQFFNAINLYLYYLCKTKMPIKKYTMDNNFKTKFDQLLVDIHNINDLPSKLSILHYIVRQADYMIWSLEEEGRQFENSNSY